MTQDQTGKRTQKMVKVRLFYIYIFTENYLKFSKIDSVNAGNAQLNVTDDVVSHYEETPPPNQTAPPHPKPSLPPEKKARWLPRGEICEGSWNLDEK